MDELGGILRNDRERKQMNAGLYAKSFMPAYVSMNETKLAERFSNQFKLSNFKNNF